MCASGGSVGIVESGVEFTGETTIVDLAVEARRELHPIRSQVDQILAVEKLLRRRGRFATEAVRRTGVEAPVQGDRVRGRLHGHDEQVEDARARQAHVGGDSGQVGEVDLAKEIRETRSAIRCLVTWPFDVRWQIRVPAES